MSFILDALRKSDAKRRMGQSPNLDHSLAGGQPGPTTGARNRMFILAVFALLLVAVVTAVFLARERIADQVAGWLGPDESAISPADPQPQDSPVVLPDPYAGADRPSRRPTGDTAAADLVDEDPDTALPRERIVSDPDEIERRLERLVAQQEDADESAGDTAPEPEQRRRDRRQAIQSPTNIVMAEPRVTDPEAAEPAEVAEAAEMYRLEQLMAEARARREARTRDAVGEREGLQPQAPRPPVEPGAPARPQAGESAPDAQPPLQVAAVAEPGRPWEPEAREYVRSWELPLSVRRNLPELNLTIHVYSAEPRQRFVLVNGQRFVTGDSLADGVRLVDIRREGAIVDFRDYRFLLEP